MTQIGRVYGEALYILAREEGLDAVILAQLNTLDSCFRQEPDYIQLLSTPNLPKRQRCQILDDCFQGKVEAYLLNFLKILTEKGYMRHFFSCAKHYRRLYDQEHHILPVTAVTVVALTDEQKEKLTERLYKLTGKHIALTNKLDAAVIGGMRLDYDGKRVDDTVAHRLESIQAMLKTTVL